MKLVTTVGNECSIGVETTRLRKSKEQFAKQYWKRKNSLKMSITRKGTDRTPTLEQVGQNISGKNGNTWAPTCEKVGWVDASSTVGLNYFLLIKNYGKSVFRVMVSSLKKYIEFSCSSTDRASKKPVIDLDRAV